MQILLISASVSGLQSMLDICLDYGHQHLMLFNPRKSLCCHFGPQSVKVSALKLGDAFIEWVKSFKYLGHTFIGGHTISIDFHIIQRKFYAVSAPELALPAPWLFLVCSPILGVGPRLRLSVCLLVLLSLHPARPFRPRL